MPKGIAYCGFWRVQYPIILPVINNTAIIGETSLATSQRDLYTLTDPIYSPLYVRTIETKSPIQDQTKSNMWTPSDSKGGDVGLNSPYRSSRRGRTSPALSPCSVNACTTFSKVKINGVYSLVLKFFLPSYPGDGEACSPQDHTHHT